MRSAKNHLDKSEPKSESRIECAGKTVVSDCWVKLGFNREELNALHQVARGISPRKKRNPGNAAALLLRAALMHWEVLEPLIIADEAYAEAEGFTCREHFRTKIIAQKFDLQMEMQA